MADKQQDKEYLANEEYDDTRELDTRVQLQERYGTAPELWFRWVFERLDLAPGVRVLDVGSGPGYIWHNNRHQLPPGLTLVLSDLSQEMAEAARRRLQQLPARLSCLVADGERLPLADGYVSLVVALGVLDHLPNLGQFMQEVKRVLQPGGRFVASAGGPRHLQEMQALAQPFLPAQEYGGDPEQFGLHNGVELLAPYCTSVERQLYTDALVFEDAGPVVDYLLSEQQEGAVDAAALTQHLEERLAEDPLRVTREKGLFIATINNR